MQSKEHWENVYSTKAADAVSWFQRHAEHSLRLIHDTKIPKSAAIIDVGGGASVLVDNLLAEGYSNITVLDISGAALNATKQRLRADAERVRWIEADITCAPLDTGAYHLWHDRAAFHFLTDPDERKIYVETMSRAVKSGGHVIVATFAEDGPTKCSGLPVMRYSAEGLRSQFGNQFTLVEHVTGPTNSLRHRAAVQTIAASENRRRFRIYRGDNADGAQDVRRST